MPGCEYIRCDDIKGTNCYCDEIAKELLLKRIRKTGVAPGGIRFFGSGNYHYASYLTTSLITEPYTLVMVDHHPDMRAPMMEGMLSCGGWVRECLLNQPLLNKVLLVGVDETLFREEWNALQQEADDISIKERALCIEHIAISKMTKDAEEMKKAWNLSPGFIQTLQNALPKDLPVFLSVDLDVLSEDEVQTNWDQGEMTIPVLLEIIRTVCSVRRLIGVDVCGAPT